MLENKIRIRRSADGGQQVYDILRRRWVALTPEEEVRQHFVHFLIRERSYPMGLMGNEMVVRLNGMAKRCDTLVSDREGNPKMIIEYKAPQIAITQKVFDQVSRYNSVMHVDYLIVSNGRQSFCARMNYETMKFEFLEDIPAYENL